MRSPSCQQEITQIGIRIPVDMKTALEQAARDDYRSVNGFLTLLIQEALAARTALSSPTPEKQ